MLWRWPNKLRFKSKSRWWPKPWSALNSLAVNQYVIPWRANIDPKLPFAGNKKPAEAGQLDTDLSNLSDHHGFGVLFLTTEHQEQATE